MVSLNFGIGHGGGGGIETGVMLMAYQSNTYLYSNGYLKFEFRGRVLLLLLWMSISSSRFHPEDLIPQSVSSFLQPATIFYCAE